MGLRLVADGDRFVFQIQPLLERAQFRLGIVDSAGSGAAVDSFWSVNAIRRSPLDFQDQKQSTH